ncbi:MAG: hypothetical protein K5876_06775 [Ruminiclostridium sp.]|nr:hypothetical protein [Ruminiclostridium sp.]
MAGGVIKGRTTTYVYVNSFDTDEPVMKTVYGRRPEKKNTPAHLTEAEKAVEAMLAEPDEETESSSADSGDTVSAEEARIEREKLIAEYEAIRSKYEKEAEQFVIHAKEKATEIYDKTKQMAEQTVREARTEADNIRKQAEEEAKRLAESSKKQGYDEGMKQGYDEGYVKALKKCKESLVELKQTAEQITADKTEIMMQYERQLFDTIFDICQKVTIGALGQKDKAVITRMIREAGKKYKASKYVKLTLSKLDVSEEAEIDEQLLKDVFRSCEHVDVEILEDAPAGTLLVDDGAEITDASIMTQLKMVEQLGKGKYRDKDIKDMIRDQAAEKPKRGAAKKKPAKSEEDDSGIPDVVYKDGKETEDGDAGEEETD